MLKMALKQSMELRQEGVELKVTEIKRIESVPSRIQTLKADVSSTAGAVYVVPEVANSDMAMIERNYNELSYHMRISDRQLTRLRQRTDRLRQRDQDIREHMKNIRKRAKMIADNSPRKDDIYSTIIISNSSPNDAKKDIQCFVPKSETGSGTLRKPSKRSISECEQAGVISNVASRCGTVTDRNSGQTKQRKVVCDVTMMHDDITCTRESDNEEAGTRPVPPKRRSKFPTHDVTVAPTINNTHAIETKAVTTECESALEIAEGNTIHKTQMEKLRLFVGERYDMGKGKKEILKQELKLVCMTSPMDLGISPNRLTKAAKKMPFMSSSLAQRVKLSKTKITKSVWNILKKEGLSCKHF